MQLRRPVLILKNGIIAETPAGYKLSAKRDEG